MNKLCSFKHREIDDFLLPEQHPSVQQEIARARDVAQKRQDKLIASASGQQPPKKARTTPPKWAERHTKALINNGVEEWWTSSLPSAEILTKFPGLHALTERQADLCRVRNIRLPDRRRCIVDLSQNLRSASNVRGVANNFSDIMTPGSDFLITHRGRMATGHETLLLQGLQYDKDHARVLDMPSDLLQSLAGNAFNAFCCGAALLVKKTIEARLHVASVVRSRTEAPPQRQATMDDLLSFDD